MIRALVLTAVLALASGAHAQVTEIRTFAEAAPPTPSAGLEGRFVARTHDGLPYRLLTPPGPGRHPLVVVLHGSGAIGTDNVSQLGAFARAWAEPALADLDAYVVVPQAPTRSADYQPGDDGLMASRPGLSLPTILALVENLATRLPVDRGRIYVVGFSMGGSAALQALLMKPELFAAAVAFAPVPPPRDQAAKLAGVPMMLVHGTADTENPYASDKAWAEALAKAGGHSRMIVYDAMDHRVPPDMIAARDWRDWLFAQRR